MHLQAGEYDSETHFREYEYNISFSFGRFQPKSEDSHLILSQETQTFIKWKDHKPYILEGDNSIECYNHFRFVNRESSIV